MNEDQKNIEKCLSEQVGAEIVHAATGDKFDALVTEAWTGERPAQPYTSWIVEFKSLLILLLRKLYYTPLSLFSNTSIKDFIAGLQATIVTLQAAIASMLGDIETSYQKVSEKGGTIPQEQTSANLPAAIASIPTGANLDDIYVTVFSTREANQSEVLDLRYIVFDTSAISNLRGTNVKQVLNVRGQTSSAANMFYNFFYLEKVSFADFTVKTDCNIMRAFASTFKWMDATGLKLAATEASDLTQFTGNTVETIIGDHTLEEVLDGLSALTGKATSFKFKYPLLRRADFRAIINGLADLTGQTTQTMTIGSTNLAKLTADDLAIAYAKNWNVL